MVRIVLFAAVPTIALHAVWVARGAPLDLRGMVCTFMGFAAVVFIVSLGLSAGFSQRAQRAADALASRGVCAACGYDMREAIERGAGRFECAECGAAWRLQSGDRDSS